jgi:16S rRNA (uracil1498-N3)-methyltransferase
MNDERVATSSFIVHRLSLVNLVLLFDADFVALDTVILGGRRYDHITRVHRVSAGDTLVVGVEDGRIGTGTLTRIDDDLLEMRVMLDRDPPPSLPLTLVVALPRPKVVNRVVAGAASMGVKRMIFINAWRVEKSYWSSPRLADENLRAQAIAGLEQARDTVMPSIETRRFFRRFVEDELPDIARDTLKLVAHPRATDECPRGVREPATLVIGPEGGFIDAEIASLERIGFRAVSIGARILRVETAVAALIARLY